MCIPEVRLFALKKVHPILVFLTLFLSTLYIYMVAKRIASFARGFGYPKVVTEESRGYTVANLIEAQPFLQL